LRGGPEVGFGKMGGPVDRAHLAEEQLVMSVWRFHCNLSYASGQVPLLTSVYLHRETNVDPPHLQEAAQRVAPASCAGVNSGNNCPPRTRIAPVQRSMTVIS